MDFPQVIFENNPSPLNCAFFRLRVWKCIQYHRNLFIPQYDNLSRFVDSMTKILLNKTFVSNIEFLKYKFPNIPTC